MSNPSEARGAVGQHYGTDELANRIRQALQNPHSDSFAQALQVRKRRVLDRVVRIITVLGFVLDGYCQPAVLK
jgi:hypothetical protein